MVAHFGFKCWILVWIVRLPRAIDYLLQFKFKQITGTHTSLIVYKMSLVMRKPGFCICENKDADQVRGYREADQHLFSLYS